VTPVSRDRLLVAATLATAVLMCWAWLVPAAGDMYGSMTGVSAWMAAGSWDLTHVALLFAMWVVMMVGMMLPSATPTLLLYAAVVRSHDGTHVKARTYAFAGGYLLVWCGFSVVATALQRLLSASLLLSPMMQLRSRAVAGALLLTAGLYQITPAKRTCLASCRAPAAFIARYWRQGNSGALRMGVIHGIYCLGCCWALMLLLFAGGVMNLYVIAAITIFILVEKLGPLAWQAGRLSGGLLMASGAWLLLTR